MFVNAKSKIHALLAAVGLALLLCAGLALPAFAESGKGLDNWTVTFTGSKMESNFSSSTLSDEIASLQPGDDMTFAVTLVNDSNSDARFYMKNTVLDTLEDLEKNNARDAGYDYKLSYVGPSGQATVIYDSMVGGEGSKLLGLKGATSSLENFFYLDTLGPGKTGQVKLYVSLDGETQGNYYQDTFAKLEMVFAADNANGSGSSAISGSNKSSSSPKTGDELSFEMILCSVAALVGLVLLVVAVRKEMQNRRALNLSGASTDTSAGDIND